MLTGIKNKMSTLKKHLIFIGLLIISACSHENNEIEREMSVMNDIFKQLTDSLISHPAYPPPPPPSPPHSSNKEGNLIYSNGVLKYKKLGLIDKSNAKKL